MKLKNPLQLLILLCLTCVFTSHSNAQSSDDEIRLLIGDKTVNYTSYEFATCEDEIAFLDQFHGFILARERGIGFVVVYGSLKERDHIRTRIMEIRRYLIEIKDLEPEKLIVVHGGKRKRIAVSLWLVSSLNDVPLIDSNRAVERKTRLGRGEISHSCSELF